MALVGKLLKYNRLRQQKKQEEVCSGICSVSYYSKIENNKIEPTDEVFDQLLARLNMTRAELHQVDRRDMKKRLLEWHHAMTAEEWKRAEQLEARIEERLEFFDDERIHLLYRLFLLRKAAAYWNRQNVLEMIAELELFPLQNIPEDIYFYFHKVNAAAYAFLEHYEQSKASIRKAASAAEDLILPEAEVLDFYVMVGRVSIQTGEFTTALHYTKKALRVFDRHYDLLQSGRARVMAAQSYRGMEWMDSAEKEIEQASKISMQLREQHLESLVLQEKGELMAVRGRSMDAVQMFQQSYSRRAGGARLVTIKAILREFESMEQHQDILSWVAHGFETLTAVKKTRELTPEEERYEITFIYYLHKYEKHRSYRFEEILHEKVIPFFRDRKDWLELAFYLREAAIRSWEKQQYNQYSKLMEEALDALWQRVR
ncbi:helix-turn-helix transcriptional regulator [Alkalicoccus chagannorensis]